MNMQELRGILNVKTLNDDELIDFHLKTLAKWTVKFKFIVVL